MTDVWAPGPLPGQVDEMVADELGQVRSTGQALIDRLGELVDARRAAHDLRLVDWSGPHRDRFDEQMPASQADLASLIDHVQSRMRAASGAVDRYVDDVTSGHGGEVEWV